jgi:predicted amidohydrolase
LRARAIEGQSWVIAAAQWGKHPQSRQTYGHSMVIDPWGTIVAEAADETAIIVADLDPGVLTRVRESLPSLKHRRL